MVAVVVEQCRRSGGSDHRRTPLRRVLQYAERFQQRRIRRRLYGVTTPLDYTDGGPDNVTDYLLALDPFLCRIRATPRRMAQPATGSRRVRRRPPISRTIRGNCCWRAPAPPNQRHWVLCHGETAASPPSTSSHSTSPRPDLTTRRSRSPLRLTPVESDLIGADLEYFTSLRE